MLPLCILSILTVALTVVVSGVPVFPSDPQEEICGCCVTSGDPVCCMLCDANPASRELSKDALDKAYVNILDRLSDKFGPSPEFVELAKGLHAKRQRGRKGTHDERFYKFQIGRKRPHDKESKHDDSPFRRGGDLDKRHDPFFHQSGFGKRSSTDLFAEHPRLTKEKLAKLKSALENADWSDSEDSRDLYRFNDDSIDSQSKNEVDASQQKRTLRSRLNVDYAKKPWRAVPYNSYKGYNFRPSSIIEETRTY